ncbi:hypothetical protein FA15DRAFT_671126 [Coprinopsis marcescibilis]|uniref:Nephrocystin 3-like N-terminal domain-containing protein n=1 Tax=Coprinopsis marcescibilis TaxID=230819 RepID=A0A5C3L3Q4_COPMA|nr:hypothetical protein FA15DRAFT_671126 [Coprinopsis marcescibilis]
MFKFFRSRSSPAVLTSNLPPEILPIPYPDTPKSKSSSKGPERDPEVPNKWQTTRDPYWMAYTSHWLRLARDIYQRHLVVNSSQLLQADRKKLITAFSGIHSLALQYDECIKAGDHSFAREVAVAICDRVKKYRGVERDSLFKMTQLAILQANVAITPQGYVSLRTKRRKEATYHYAHRRLQDCDINLRKDAILQAAEWLGDIPPGKNILWLTGEKGCGKSVVANYFAYECDKRGGLASSFVFVSHTDKDSLVETFFINIATDIAEYLGEAFVILLANACDALMVEGEEFFGRSITLQLTQLLVPVYWKLLPEDRQPLFILLDGLDKCDIGALGALFEFIKESIKHLPICYFISSTAGPQGAIALELQQGPLAKHVQSQIISDYRFVEDLATPKATKFSIPEIPVSPPG